MPRKLGVNSAQRKAILRNQASNLLWYGRIETTLATAKEVRSYTEKIITLAMNTYEDTVEEKITIEERKGQGRSRRRSSRTARRSSPPEERS